jgi:archaellum component FlaC
MEGLKNDFGKVDEAMLNVSKGQTNLFSRILRIEKI